MNTYNKVMLYFWLLASIVTFIIVTFKGVQEGFERWSVYYLFSGLSLLMYFVRKWMIKRMQKHMEYLQNQQGK
jgi:SNF family Na+-dependent transporter